MSNQDHSPNGQYVLEISVRSFGIGLDVLNPRLRQVADGAVLLDLWDSAWDAHPEWTGRGNLVLSLRLYPDGGPAIEVEINPTAPSFRFSAAPSQWYPLNEFRERITDWYGTVRGRQSASSAPSYTTGPVGRLPP